MTDPMKFLADPNPPLVLETLLNLIDDLQSRLMLVEAEFSLLRTQVAQMNTPNTYISPNTGTTWGGDTMIFGSGLTTSTASSSLTSQTTPTFMINNDTSNYTLTIEDLRRELKAIYETNKINPDAPEV